MKVKQFEYKPLSHYSYAVISNGEMARANNAKIIAVIEPHPHADFVSSHLQIHNETGAIIYNSEKLGAEYPYTPFDEGHNIKIGNATLSAINTPGHSPDSITIVATQGDETVLFTGDTVFIGDVGRPDLREKAGNIKAKRQKLAEAMYDTIQHKFTELPDNAVVYPAHGAGSLCGKSLSEANSSTLGNERMGNWAFKKQTQDQFVEKLLDSQPFIPSYFGFNVDVNKSGAANLRTAIAAVPFMMNTSVDGLIIDVRNEIEFKKGSLKGSINIPATSEDSRFETWLGAIVEPNEKFSLVIDNPEDLDHILNRVAKIGYENHLQAVVTLPEGNLIKLPQIDINDFRNNPKKYTILDVRNESEVEEEKFFENALSHPLNELRKTANEIPTDKPIVVHCAGGYRSAVGSSILAKELKATQVFDLGEQINEFK